jgi:AcrR family transcriptional regulator
MLKCTDWTAPATRERTSTRSTASRRPENSSQRGDGDKSDSAAAPAPVPAKTRGRPLSFDRQAALDKAMHVFWEHGYEAASIADLTAAMGITPPSLYTAFGDKAHLFLEAVEAYGKGPGGFGARALAEEPTARGAVQRLLEEAADELTRDCHPLGCMMVMATTNCSVAAEHVQAALAKRRALGVENMQARIQRGIDEGELPAHADAGALANFFAMVYQGMSMQAKDGASKEALLASVALAMRSWPDALPKRGRAVPPRRAPGRTTPAARKRAQAAPAGRS